MRIGIDVRTLQLETRRKRPVGTHLRGWIEAAQSLNSPFSFSLLFDPALPTPQVGLSSPQWQLQPLILPFSLPGRTPKALHGNQNDEFLFDSTLESFLLEHGVDVFHTTDTFTGELFSGRRLYHTRWVVALHNLGPLLFLPQL